MTRENARYITVAATPVSPRIMMTEANGVPASEAKGAMKPS